MKIEPTNILYPTVAAMIADQSNLQAGDIVTIQGYHSPGDAGGGLMRIFNNQSLDLGTWFGLVDKQGDYMLLDKEDRGIYFNLSNGKGAKRLIEGRIYRPEMFGARGYGSFEEANTKATDDDTLAVKLMYCAIDRDGGGIADWSGSRWWKMPYRRIPAKSWSADGPQRFNGIIVGRNTTTIGAGSTGTCIFNDYGNAPLFVLLGPHFPGNKSSGIAPVRNLAGYKATLDSSGSEFHNLGVGFSGNRSTNSPEFSKVSENSCR